MSALVVEVGCVYSLNTLVVEIQLICKQTRPLPDVIIFLPTHHDTFKLLAKTSQSLPKLYLRGIIRLL